MESKFGIENSSSLYKVDKVRFFSGKHVQIG